MALAATRRSRMRRRFLSMLKITLTSVLVDDQGRVAFRSKPTAAGPVTLAVLDDTCGNLIQIQQVG
jgi:hypothetical protein